ncbi:MAG: hypothetical protein M9928_07900 [Anaerolineae bacterium]|nr:hypothetical protein [Anaerolineae bacterium]MCO5204938.1 hypothetical protein [Anaerolineae bacterium]
MDVFTQILTDVFALTVDVMAAFFVAFGIAFGFASLFAGRRLFWIFTGAVGLTAGFYIGRELLVDSPHFVTATLTIVLGILGALAALYLAKPAASLAAFIVLGSLAYIVASAATLPDWLTWVLFAGLGILAAVLAWRWFDWGVIISSALVGAIVAAVGLNAVIGLVPLVGTGLFFVLLVAGIWYQARDMRRTRRYEAQTKPVAVAGAAKVARTESEQAASAQPTTLTVDVEPESAETDPSV